MSSVPASNLPRTPDSHVTELSETGFSMQSRPSWQRQLANAIRSSTELLAALGLPVPNPPASGTPQESTATGFPTLVPISFLNRMEFGNADDPLLKQVLPTSAENLSVAGFVSDPVNDEAARIAPGLLQKYAGRVLLIATGACAVHCRYCFRRDYPYQQEPRTAEDWQPAINRIANDHSITEVILSGGDPLILNDDRLSSLCRQLDAISNIERLRLHTRLPIVLPDRVTSSLLNLLTSLRSQTIVVVHSNHGNEIAGDCEDALKRLVRSGIPVLNQTVLLHGINDSVEALETLSRRLVNAGVIPYYLHHLDRVQGAAHFESDRDLGIRLLQELRKRLPGYAVPQFVEEIPGEPGKTLI